MTIAELQANEEIRQREFPVCASKVFLSHAGVCPLPRRVADAIARHADDCTRGDQEDAVPKEFTAETRSLAASLIQARPDEIAFVGPTSLGLSFVAGGLPWRRGDNVLVYFNDYPSNVYPWLALAEQGVEVRYLNIRELGKIRLVDVQGQVDENTRLVALASCHYISGWRINLEAIGKFLRSRDILFCVDGIQTLGAMPLSVRNVDFLAADAHKWLLGPCAAGILYVRREVRDRLRPIVHGWHNVRSPNFLTQEDMRYRPDAGRYEAGTHNFAGIFGLRAALELIHEYGITEIGLDLVRKRMSLVEALHQRGYTVLQPAPPPDNIGAIVSFFRPATDMSAIHSRLLDAGVVSSLRELPDHTVVIRFSPHFYNTDRELERAVSLL